MRSPHSNEIRRKRKTSSDTGHAALAKAAFGILSEHGGTNLENDTF